MNGTFTPAGIKQALRTAMARRGWALQRLSAEDQRYFFASYDDSVPLPEGASADLRADHPRLRELRQRYQALSLPASSHSIWDAAELEQQLNLPWFRGDNAYVWQFRQLRSQARMKQFLALRYVESRDELGLLNRLEEDGRFGCWRFQYGERAPVSRDLLDSVSELNFLERQLGLGQITDLRVLDIGAGYGRLAHRMASALDNLAGYDCVDAIPESTFLCEYYLRHRGIDDKARAIPLDELDKLKPPGAYQLAVNIHSFTECTHAAVRWWLEKLAELRVQNLLIIPNDPEAMMTSEVDGSRKDFAPDIESVGYRLVHKEPVFDDAELREMTGVQDHYFLYRMGA